MQSFLSRHAAQIKGVLSGFDRIRFRGTLRWIATERGLRNWLWHANVLLKDFKAYAMELTDTIRQATQRFADEAQRPLQYLHSSSTRKEDFARMIAEQDHVTQGLVCVLTCVEPCLTFTVGPNRAAKKLELRSFTGKCLHQYFYLIDPQLGWLNVRLQTWFPFNVHVVINGREWLSQQLCRNKMSFQQRENCFVDLEDVPGAQRLMDRQLKSNWSRLLDRLVRQVHPSHRNLFGKEQLHYYWSADETEWASDVMFRSSEDLASLYPRLVRHAITTYGGNDVLRFLGRRPSVKQLTAGELVTSLATRPEGTRLKHSLDRNSIKMYDKQESVLRVETTINNPRKMRSYRAAENDPHGPKAWRGLRKGVADLYRRAEISQKCNDRYFEGLSAVDCESTLAESTAALCERTVWHGRSVRALNPLAEEDAKLLQAVSQGEFALHGFRNQDLRSMLFENTASENPRQEMAKVTRLIRILRAHGLAQKIPHTHRYMITPRGRLAITALLAARQAKTNKLTELAA